MTPSFDRFLFFDDTQIVLIVYSSRNLISTLLFYYILVFNLVFLYNLCIHAHYFWTYQSGHIQFRTVPGRVSKLINAKVPKLYFYTLKMRVYD